MCTDFVRKNNFPFEEKSQNNEPKMKLGNFFESATKTVSIIQICFDIALGETLKDFYLVYHNG